MWRKNCITSKQVENLRFLKEGYWNLKSERHNGIAMLNWFINFVNSTVWSKREINNMHVCPTPKLDHCSQLFGPSNISRDILLLHLFVPSHVASWKEDQRHLQKKITCRDTIKLEARFSFCNQLWWHFLFLMISFIYKESSATTRMWGKRLLLFPNWGAHHLQFHSHEIDT